MFKVIFDDFGTRAAHDQRASVACNLDSEMLAALQRIENFISFSITFFCADKFPMF